jgi:acyl dehydratase
MKLPPFFEIGHRTEIGSHLFTSDNIVTFARKYDTQIFHVDPEAAKASLFGGHCASGWHTAAVWMRKQRDNSARFNREWEAAGNGRIEYGPSPGFHDLKWLRPVYAGDEVSYSMTTTACRQSGSRPGWWLLTGVSQGVNQNGEPVISFESSVFIRVTD